MDGAAPETCPPDLRFLSPRGPTGGKLKGSSLTDLFASPHFSAYLTLAVLAAMFLLFVLETYPVEVTAMVGAAVLVVCGIVPSDGVLKVFSNPAPWTIAAMFIAAWDIFTAARQEPTIETAEPPAPDEPGSSG